MQRDRDFASYQDIETRSELRPSAWAEPRGDWGSGHVELIEIPTTTELNDNIVLFWVPDEPLVSDAPRAFSYTLYWDGDGARPPAGYVASTRRDRGTLPNAYRFVIDFAGETVRNVSAERPPAASVTAGPRPDAAEVLDQHLVKHPITGGWRLTFQVRPHTKDPIELRAYLANGDDVLTETWSYVLLQ
jgi:glucans biosynthesis protein